MYTQGIPPVRRSRLEDTGAGSKYILDVYYR